MTRTTATIIATAFLSALAIEFGATPLRSQPAQRIDTTGLIASSVDRSNKGDRLTITATTSGSATAEVRLEGCESLWSPLATPKVAYKAGRCLS